MRVSPLAALLLAPTCILVVDCGGDEVSPVTTGIDASMVPDVTAEGSAGGDTGASDAGGSDAQRSFTVGGTVTGLAGSGLVVQNNGGNDIGITQNGPFKFTTSVASGSNYAVTVKTQPSSPPQTCTVSGGTGTVGSGDVTSVVVNCATNRYTVGGTISGLSGTVVLQNNGADDLSVSANGSFAFAATVTSGQGYAVTVKTQPSSPPQTCTVTSESGTVTSANVTSVHVTCTTNSYAVGGTVGGLQGTGLVLQNNGADDLSVSANGSFAFATKVTSGQGYAVTVKTQPTNPLQTCAVTSESGTVTSANVTSVAVTCTPTCGNGTVEAPEQCDDGARAAGDGCSTTCTIESGWDCTGTRSVCNRSCFGGGNGVWNCGEPFRSESCCTSLPVTGVTTPSFSRSYDGVTSGFTDPQYKAQVSDFLLDKYEITVGRFRKFVDAVVGGWRPAAGSGKHTHLNGGSGLAAANGGGHEPGWDSAWDTNLPSQKSAWDSTGELACSSLFQTWTATPTPGNNERRPINCINWYQAYAFCIWDGGFLPSEGEWNYAAAGGTEHRTYPWGSTAPGPNADLAIYGCYYPDGPIGVGGTGVCTGVRNIDTVGLVAAGNGKWQQSNLAGNVREWVLDWYAGNYPNPPLYSETNCVNCANTTQGASSTRMTRGGDFSFYAVYLRAVHRNNPLAPTGRLNVLGARCARRAP